MDSLKPISQSPANAQEPPPLPPEITPKSALISAASAHTEAPQLRGEGRENPTVGLTDVLLILAAFAAAFFFCGIVGWGILSIIQHGHRLDPRQAAQNALFVVPLQLAVYLIVVGFMAFLVWVRYGKGLLEAIGWNTPARAKALAALCFGMALAIASQFAAALVQRWIPKSLPIDQYFSSTSAAFMLAGFGVLVAPLVEEIFFRGFLYPALARWTGPAPAIVVTAAGFALIHQDQLGRAWAPLLIIFAVGAVFTIIRARYRSVAICVLVHMGYNFMLFTLIFVATQGFRHMEKLR